MKCPWFHAREVEIEMEVEMEGCGEDGDGLSGLASLISTSNTALSGLLFIYIDVCL